MSWFSPPNVSELLRKRDTRGLTRALTHKDSSIRERAARALGDLKNPEAVTFLLAGLEDQSWKVRREMVFALWKIGDQRAVEPLIRTLADEDEEVRLNAALGLGILRDQRAVQPLWSLFGRERARKDDYKGEVAAGAAESLLGLARLFPTEISKLALNALQRRDGNRKVQKLASEILGEVGDTRALGPLIACLDDSIGETSNTDAEMLCTAVVDALGKLRNPQAVDPLLTALKRSPGSRLRRAIVEALGGIGDGRATQALAECLYDHEVADKAAVALANLADPDAAELCRLAPFLAELQHNSISVVGSAARQLGLARDERAVRGLVMALEHWAQSRTDQLRTVLEGENINLEALEAEAQLLKRREYSRHLGKYDSDTALMESDLDSYWAVRVGLGSIIEALKAIGGAEADAAIAACFARIRD